MHALLLAEANMKGQFAPFYIIIVKKEILPLRWNLITKIILLLVVVGVIFGWDKILNLFKAFFEAKKEFKKGLEEKEEEGKPVIKVVEKE
jgi:sec-independent protein translocase protein TatA